MSPDRSEPTVVICPECGEVIEIKDIAQLLLTLHQANACSVRMLITGGE